MKRGRVTWLREVLGRYILALRLRCAVCGKGEPFVGLLEVRDHCGVCGYHFERESGYFIGSIYFNYGATVVIEVAGYFAFESFFGLTFLEQAPIWTAFSLLFPFWFLRYARSFWMALDVSLSPPEEGDFVVREETPQPPAAPLGR
jgi:uncharacterized protein (DUF983 family)